MPSPLRIPLLGVLLLATLAALLVALGGESSSATTTASVPCAGSAPVAYKHIVFVLMENHSSSQVIGHSPYLNGLAGKCAVAPNQANLTHPSLPNYMALTSGATHFTSDCTTCTTSGNSIFQQVGATGWKAYEETMPSAGYLGATSGRYAKKHNPASYYTAIRTAYQTRGVPLGSNTTGALHTDVVNGTLPRYSFVTPNMCSDEHDCSVATGDAWLAKMVPMILAGRNYQAGDTLIVVTYDENESCCPGGVYTVVVAPSINAGTTITAAFNHYALLRLSEAELGLPLLGAAANAPDIRGALHV